ncbi:hypothetical protein GJ496_006896 [Pomphorhynchus laevis]|nr:hypothetical protein GJ496_006896 [Pomphorhynchus laevis]
MNTHYKFWSDVLKNPTYVSAPMVNYSDQPFRMLLRNEGNTDLCFTQMYHSRLFVEDSKYRSEALKSMINESPLIMQFCSNDPEIFEEAVRLSSPYCDATDLNLGCPQGIARSGHYGAYLQNEWQLTQKLIKSGLQHNPITAKIRIFPDITKSVQYAQMLESCGISALTVHGRTIEQKGHATGLASWKHIKAIKDALKIPVIANGNIQRFNDIERCLGQTGCDAVMSAEGLLYNPLLFTGKIPLTFEVGLRYLDNIEKFDKSSNVRLPDYVKGHMHKICHSVLNDHPDIRNAIQSSSTMSDIRDSLNKLNQKFIENLTDTCWACKPFQRSSPYCSNKRNHLISCEISSFVNDDINIESLFT